MIGIGSAELQGVLEAADHREVAIPRQWAKTNAVWRILLHVNVLAPAQAVLAAALIATKPFFDTDRGPVGALIRIGGHALGLK